MIRQKLPIEEIAKILKKYKKEDIEISQHYIKYLDEGRRDIGKEEIINFLTEKEVYFVEKQVNSWVRYKVVYELSHKYDLIIVVKEEPKVLKVISAYKTNRRLKEKWKKLSKSIMKN
jgi:hypothetical protein